MRVHIVIPIDQMGAANDLASSLDPDTGGADTFGSVRLSSTGAEPVTHTGCSGEMSDSIVAELPQFQKQISGAQYQINGSWDDFIASHGLKRVEVPPELIGAFA